MDEEEAEVPPACDGEKQQEPPVSNDQEEQEVAGPSSAKLVTFIESTQEVVAESPIETGNNSAFSPAPLSPDGVVGCINCRNSADNAQRAYVAAANASARVVKFFELQTENVQLQSKNIELCNYVEECKRQNNELSTQLQLKQVELESETVQRIEAENKMNMYMKRALEAKDHIAAADKWRAQYLESVNLIAQLRDRATDLADKLKRTVQLAQTESRRRMKADTQLESQKEKFDALKQEFATFKKQLKPNSRVNGPLKRAEENTPLSSRNRSDSDKTRTEEEQEEQPIGHNIDDDSDDDTAKVEMMLKDMRVPESSEDEEARARREMGEKATVFVSPRPRRMTRGGGRRRRTGSEGEDGSAQGSNKRLPTSPPPRTAPAIKQGHQKALKARQPAQAAVKRTTAIAAEEEAFKKRLAVKLTQSAEDVSSNHASAAPIVSTIHGRKTMTVREQQEKNKLTAKETIARLKKQDAKSGRVDDKHLPSPSTSSTNIHQSHPPSDNDTSRPANNLEELISKPPSTPVNVEMEQQTSLAPAEPPTPTKKADNTDSQVSTVTGDNITATDTSKQLLPTTSTLPTQEEETGVAVEPEDELSGDIVMEGPSNESPSPSVPQSILMGRNDSDVSTSAMAENITPETTQSNENPSTMPAHPTQSKRTTIADEALEDSANEDEIMEETPTNELTHRSLGAEANEEVAVAKARAAPSKAITESHGKHRQRKLAEIGLDLSESEDEEGGGREEEASKEQPAVSASSEDGNLEIVTSEEFVTTKGPLDGSKETQMEVGESTEPGPATKVTFEPDKESDLQPPQDTTVTATETHLDREGDLLPPPETTVTTAETHVNKEGDLPQPQEITVAAPETHLGREGDLPPPQIARETPALIAQSPVVLSEPPTQQPPPGMSADTPVECEQGGSIEAPSVSSKESVTTTVTIEEKDKRTAELEKRKERIREEQERRKEAMERERIRKEQERERALKRAEEIKKQKEEQKKKQLEEERAKEAEKKKKQEEEERKVAERKRRQEEEEERKRKQEEEARKVAKRDKNIESLEEQERDLAEMLRKVQEKKKEEEWKKKELKEKGLESRGMKEAEGRDKLGLDDSSDEEDLSILEVDAATEMTSSESVAEPAVSTKSRQAGKAPARRPSAPRQPRASTSQGRPSTSQQQASTCSGHDDFLDDILSGASHGNVEEASSSRGRSRVRIPRAPARVRPTPSSSYSSLLPSPAKSPRRNSREPSCPPNSSAQERASRSPKSALLCPVSNLSLVDNSSRPEDPDEDRPMVVDEDSDDDGQLVVDVEEQEDDGEERRKEKKGADEEENVGDVVVRKDDSNEETKKLPAAREMDNPENDDNDELEGVVAKRRVSHATLVAPHPPSSAVPAKRAKTPTKDAPEAAKPRQRVVGGVGVVQEGGGTGRSQRGGEGGSHGGVVTRGGAIQAARMMRGAPSISQINRIHATMKKNMKAAVSGATPKRQTTNTLKASAGGVIAAPPVKAAKEVVEAPQHVAPETEEESEHATSSTSKTTRMGAANPRKSQRPALPSQKASAPAPTAKRSVGRTRKRGLQDEEGAIQPVTPAKRQARQPAQKKGKTGMHPVEVVRDALAEAAACKISLENTMKKLSMDVLEQLDADQLADIMSQVVNSMVVGDLWLSMKQACDSAGFGKGMGFNAISAGEVQFLDTAVQIVAHREEAFKDVFQLFANRLSLQIAKQRLQKGEVARIIRCLFYSLTLSEIDESEKTKCARLVITTLLRNYTPDVALQSLVYVTLLHKTAPLVEWFFGRERDPDVDTLLPLHLAGYQEELRLLKWATRQTLPEHAEVAEEWEVATKESVTEQWEKAVVRMERVTEEQEGAVKRRGENVEVIPSLNKEIWLAGLLLSPRFRIQGIARTEMVHQLHFEVITEMDTLTAERLEETTGQAETMFADTSRVHRGCVAAATARRFATCTLLALSATLNFIADGRAPDERAEMVQYVKSVIEAKRLILDRCAASPPTDEGILLVLASFRHWMRVMSAGTLHDILSPPLTIAQAIAARPTRP